MNKRYFGTDGIRGRVGISPINAEFVLKLGWAAGRVLLSGNSGLILIGKDTRTSGYMFESVLQAGLSAAGVNIGLTGPIPTPAIAYLTRTMRAKAGIVISASHNPYVDNGIKFFSAEGNKLSDEIESAIEEMLENPMTTVPPGELGKAIRINDAAARYIEFCKSTIPPEFNFLGLKIVMDCANGATYQVGPLVYQELGAEVIVLNNKPDGININRKCGSTHPEELQYAVVDNCADLGIAFDGDGDRVVMVDHLGELVDGDRILYIIARSRMQQGFEDKLVVGTVMSNYGLELAMNSMGLRFVRAQVGDRNVNDLMVAQGAQLGGESCGHIICRNKTTTGDGIVTSLQVLQAMRIFNADLHDLKAAVKILPQELVSVPSYHIDNVALNSNLNDAINRMKVRLGERTRILIRRSGTEPVIRIMVEGEDGDDIRECAKELASIVKKQEERYKPEMRAVS